MPIAHRSDLRNVAIVAHVDHGKTTLVDAMLRQTNSFGAHEHMEERAMDSNDLEREKGITILAKNTAITYAGIHATDGPVTINVIDTPGHADFGGEVERGLSMVDGVVLLVDASEGPLPQTRFVLRKALESKLPGHPAGQQDRPAGCAHRRGRRGEPRPAARPRERPRTTTCPTSTSTPCSTFRSSTPPAATAPRAGTSPRTARLPDNDDLEPLFDAILKHVPAPAYDDEAPLQAWVTNLDASPFLGRIALLRVFSGTLKKGQTVAWVRLDGSSTPTCASPSCSRPAPSSATRPKRPTRATSSPSPASMRSPSARRSPTPTTSVRSTAITVDEPAISMTIGTNTSPIVGKVKGHKLTARMVKDRLDRELIGNVSIRVVDIHRPDAWEVQGRGELALAILVENMRREGFELTVGKPQVVTRKVNGKTHEPFEHLTIDAPEEFLGAITQLMAARKGRMDSMSNHGTGWVRMEFIVPSRGLIGFRTEFLTITRGTGIANAISHGYEEWAGTITTRTNGSIVADRAGVVTPFAMVALQERMSFFVEPTQEVYGGMVIGENSRADDMDVNITKEKQLTNIRSSTSDNFEKLTPTRKLTLEEALEFAREDECVEVTPEVVRIRKVVLDQTERARRDVPAQEAGRLGLRAQANSASPID